MVIIDDSYPDNNRSSASHFIDWLNTKAGQDIPRLITDLKSKDYSDDPEKTKAYMDMRSPLKTAQNRTAHRTAQRTQAFFSTQANGTQGSTQRKPIFFG